MRLADEVDRAGRGDLPAADQSSSPVTGQLLSQAGRLRLLLACGILATVLAMNSCTTPADQANSGDRPSGGANQAAELVVLSLLADNELIRVSVRREASITGRVRLGPASPSPSVGRIMAMSADKALYVLIGQAGNSPDRILVIDTATLSIHSARDLALPTRYRSLAVGPRTGRLYLFGDRPPGRDGAGAWLTVLDPAGPVVGSWQVRPGGDRNWEVFTGSISPDEQYAVISYHSEDTEGADILRLPQGEVIPCSDRQPNTGCLSDVHGQVLATARGILAATGDSLLQVGYDGKGGRLLPTQLTGNHSMKFGIDDAGDAAYVVGSCGYVGGLGRVDLRTGEAKTLIPPGKSGTGLPKTGVCGERVEAVANGMLVIARLAGPVPTTNPGKLLFVNTADAKVIHDVSTVAEPLDLVVLAGS